MKRPIRPALADILEWNPRANRIAGTCTGGLVTCSYQGDKTRRRNIWDKWAKVSEVESAKRRARFKLSMISLKPGTELQLFRDPTIICNAQAQVALGAALALSGDLDGGIARMKQGIKLSPRDRRLAFWGWAKPERLNPSEDSGSRHEPWRIVSAASRGGLICRNGAAIRGAATLLTSHKATLRDLVTAWKRPPTEAALSNLDFIIVIARSPCECIGACMPYDHLAAGINPTNLENRLGDV
jgi:hypothetical protein